MAMTGQREAPVALHTMLALAWVYLPVGVRSILAAPGAYEPPLRAGDKGYSDCECQNGRCEKKYISTVDGIETDELRWCFVDEHKCKRKLHEAQNGSYVSFNTCGNIDDEVERKQVESGHKPLKNVTIRAWADGQVARTSSTTNDLYFNSEAMLVFAGETLRQLGVDLDDNMKYQELSHDARDKNPTNNYSACVYDIALGNLDLCLGTFFDTPFRRNFRVPFSSTVYNEDFHVVLPLAMNEPILETLKKPFAPFSLGLWLAISLAIVFSAVMNVLFEDCPCQRRRPSPGGGTHLDIMNMLYESLMSILSGGMSFVPATPSGKIFALGYGFFILAVLAAYTANLASFFIGEQHAGIKDLDGALQAHKKICYYSGLGHVLRDEYPRLNKFGVPVDNMKNLPNELLRGSCFGAIMASDWLDAVHAREELCDFTMTSQTVLSVPAGFWANTELVDVISYQVATEVTKGTWQRKRKEVVRPNQCKVQDAKEGTALDVQHITGLLVVLCGFAALAVLYRAIEVVVDSNGVGQQEKDTDEISPDHGTSELLKSMGCGYYDEEHARMMKECE